MADSDTEATHTLLTQESDVGLLSNLFGLHIITAYCSHISVHIECVCF